MGNGTDRLVERALSGLTPEVQQAFADDPIGTATSHLGLRVAEVPQVSEQRVSGGHCDGVSFLDHGVLLYARTKSKRENFTIAHEVGHWLIDNTSGIYDRIAEQPNPLIIIESLCDRIAQQLLLPEATIDRVLDGEVLRAEHLQKLSRMTHASRAASSIALARRLPGAGAVAFASRDTGAIEYSSIQPHPEHGWPTAFPWPGQELPTGSPLLNLGFGQRSTRLSAWITPWRATADFYTDGFADDYYVYLVFSDTNLWNITTGFAAQALSFDQRPTQTITCCGRTRQVRGFPCSRCRQIECPTCHECACDKRRTQESACAQCGNLVLPHLLDADGLCELCA
ncbi:MAG TPA: hypothetical protein VGM94_02335 [Galbitalea sp.]|jgi:hypothetical protein